MGPGVGAGSTIGLLEGACRPVVVGDTAERDRSSLKPGIEFWQRRCSGPARLAMRAAMLMQPSESPVVRTRTSGTRIAKSALLPSFQVTSWKATLEEGKIGPSYAGVA